MISPAAAPSSHFQTDAHRPVPAPRAKASASRGPLGTDAEASSSLDADAILRAYRGPEGALQAGVLDMAPLLVEFYKLTQTRPDALRDHQMQEIALQISQTSRFHLPKDEAIWRLADATRSQMLNLMAGHGTRMPRTPGVQKALDEFARQWTLVLDAPRSQVHPVTFAKSVPLTDRLLCAFGVDTGLHLGVHHPRDGFCVGKSAATATSASPGGSFPFTQSLLSLRADDKGLRIEVAPQNEEQCLEDDLEHLDEAMQQLHRVLETAAERGDSLVQALRKFNETAREEFRLRVRSTIPAATWVAPLHRQGDSSRSDRLWFECSLLSKRGALDPLITSAEARSRVDQIRRLVVEATDAQVARVRRNFHPYPLNDLRVSLVAGCVIQLCLQAAQKAQPGGPQFDFQVGAEEIFFRMSSTEQLVVHAVMDALGSVIPGLSPSLLRQREALQSVDTYVSMDSGDPIGCVSLRHDPSEASAADRWLPSGSGALSKATDQRLAKKAEQDNLAAAMAVALADAMEAGLNAALVASSTPSAPQARPRPIPAPRKASQAVAAPRLAPLSAPASSQPLVANSRLASPATTFDELQPEPRQPSWIARLMKGDDADMRVGDRGGASTPPILLEKDTYAHLDQDYDELLDGLLKDIRTPGLYTDFSSEVAPRLLVNCLGWPFGRTLDIHNIHGGSLMLEAGLQVDDHPPVRIVRWPEVLHYMALQNGVLMRTPAAGECFYIAVLASMEPHERQELLAAAGCTGQDAEHLATAALALRHHLARHLGEHREDYRDLLLRLQSLVA